MFEGIAFVGGIHGVGKSFICKNICNELKMEYLSASKLLKWEDINNDNKNKKVQNVLETQNRLINGLTETVQKGKHYLLDGHFCLLSNDDKIINVPQETFEQINPISLNLILGNISEIKRNLEKRDNKYYNYQLLKHLQKEEYERAKYLSKTLGITLNVVDKNDFRELLNLLKKNLEIK